MHGRLEKNEDGTVVVTLKYPHYLPIAKLCQVSKRGSLKCGLILSIG